MYVTTRVFVHVDSFLSVVYLEYFDITKKEFGGQQEGWVTLEKQISVDNKTVYEVMVTVTDGLHINQVFQGISVIYNYPIIQYCNCQLICKFWVSFKCTAIKQLLTFWYFQTSLQVIVEDVIDHDLTFTQSIYNFNITENDDTPDNVTVHTPVGQVKTMDLDLTKTDLSYRIVTSDVGHIFSVTQVCFVFFIFFSPTVNCLYFCRYKT